MKEMQGMTPSVEIVDEAQDLTLDEHVQDLMQMSELLDALKINRRRSSPKVKGKAQNRAKAKTARASRRANRG